MSLFTKIFSSVPPNPNQFDLRHFTVVVWSDAWDGVSLPVDGYTNRVILYRGEVVHVTQQRCVGGRPTELTKTGHQDYVTIADMGRVYLELARRMHVLSTPAEPPDVYLGFTMSKKMYALLRAHPDYMALVEKFRGVGWHLDTVPVARYDLVDAVARYEPLLFVEG
jgi:hypothetical protein